MNVRIEGRVRRDTPFLPSRKMSRRPVDDPANKPLGDV